LEYDVLFCPSFDVLHKMSVSVCTFEFSYGFGHKDRKVIDKNFVFVGFCWFVIMFIVFLGSGGSVFLKLSTDLYFLMHRKICTSHRERRK